MREVRVDRDEEQVRLCPEHGLEKALLGLGTIDGFLNSGQLLRWKIDSMTLFSPNATITDHIDEVLEESAAAYIVLEHLFRPVDDDVREAQLGDGDVLDIWPQRPQWNDLLIGHAMGVGHLWGGLLEHMNPEAWDCWLDVDDDTAELNWSIERFQKLWRCVDQTYVDVEGKTTDEYWEVVSLGERPPQWSHRPESPEPSSPDDPDQLQISLFAIWPYLPTEERAQSSRSYLQQAGHDVSVWRLPALTKALDKNELNAWPQGPVLLGGGQETLPAEHPVYRLSGRSVKTFHRLLGGRGETMGKVTWKELKKVRALLDLQASSSFRTNP